jgi:uncharacterized membrane protein YdbT with pleckstrin-like domain
VTSGKIQRRSIASRLKERARRRPSPVQLLALGLVAAGGIGSVLVVASSTSDAELGAIIWGVIAVIGWWFPLVAAALLVILAVLGAMASLALLFALALEEPGLPSAGPLLFWEVLLPVCCAVLFVGAHNQRAGRMPF